VCKVVLYGDIIKQWISTVFVEGDNVLFSYTQFFIYQNQKICEVRLLYLARYKRTLQRSAAGCKREVLGLIEFPNKTL
jgi:hypothetical protein